MMYTSEERFTRSAVLGLYAGGERIGASVRDVQLRKQSSGDDEGASAVHNATCEV